MSSNSIIRAGRVAAVLALLVPAAALAQTADGAASEGMPATTDAPATAPPTSPAGTGTANERVNPHLLLDDLSGGPQGSPTAQRGNPQPGTSTSIPTTNPATVRPLQQLGAGNENVAVEDTGIEGQCDPVVSLGCPSIADQLQTGTTAAGGSDAASTPAEAEGTVAPAETAN